MALGNTYNNNDKKNYSPSVQSYKMSNAESKVDATALSLSFWNKMLKVSIAPRKAPDPTNPNIVSFDWDNSGSVYLTHTKARILFNEILEFEKNPETLNNAGVNSGAEGLLSISNGVEFGANGPCIVLRKINSDNGSCEATYVYEFKRGYYSSVRNYDAEKANFESSFYDNIELEQFKTVLEQYYIASTNAVAATVMDFSKYDNSRIQTKLDLIAGKLGVETKYNNSNNSNKSSNSFFSRQQDSSSGYNSGQTSNYTNSTLDDIANSI